MSLAPPLTAVVDTAGPTSSTLCFCSALGLFPKLSQPARQGEVVRELTSLGWEPWYECPSFHPEDIGPATLPTRECPAAQTNHTISSGFLLPYTQVWVSGSAFQGLGVKPAWEVPRMVLVWHMLEDSIMWGTLNTRHKCYSKDVNWC